MNYFEIKKFHNTLMKKGVRFYMEVIRNENISEDEKNIILLALLEIAKEEVLANWGDNTLWI